jgi:uncharacterized protein (UPF0335 family)
LIVAAREMRAIRMVKDTCATRFAARPWRVQEMNMAKSGFAAGQLKSLVERVERLEEEKAALAADIREIYAEAKGLGFDTKIMRQVIRIRRLDKADRQEQEAILDLYLSALGMRN